MTTAELDSIILLPYLLPESGQRDLSYVRERSLAQSDLDIVAKTRSNPLPWRGQFSPQLVETLLRQYASPSATVLDPFAGSGTVLFECARLGHDAFGGDINPAAIALASVYEYAEIPYQDRIELIRGIGDSLRTTFKAVSTAKDPAVAMTSAVIRVARDATERHQRIFLHAFATLSDIGYRPFSVEKLRRCWFRLASLVFSLPFRGDQTIRAGLHDARSIPAENDSFDCVITSPPYINVFNYHQHCRRTMELLGWDLLRVARAEIGANRKHRQNRMLTVIQSIHDTAL